MVYCEERSEGKSERTHSLVEGVSNFQSSSCDLLLARMKRDDSQDETKPARGSSKV